MGIKPQKILLIDDEIELIDIYASQLKEAGYAVVVAGDGVEGLAMAKLEKPDLILLDLKMPKMSGTEVLTKLKEDPETKGIKVVFLTAFSDAIVPAIDVPFAQFMGATDLIKKGVGLDEFISKVKSYMGAL